MPTLHLPSNPDLDHLKGQARFLQRRVRTGEAEALAAVAHHHPRVGEVPSGADFRLIDAQLVLARLYGFASWPRLRDPVELVQRYARFPHRQPTGEASNDPVDEFLALACLVYGGDDLGRRARARTMLEAQPELAGTNIFTMAVVGDVEAARAGVRSNRAAASTSGGPFGWEPLLYVAYSRVDVDGLGLDSDPVGFARLLLDNGADPNAGYLWEGLVPPFTALTGAFGRGEDWGNQPPHRHEVALAWTLLDAGADPNDFQTLYNRNFKPDDAHLELLFEYGLGQGTGGPWAARLGATQPSPAQMLEDQLTWAAHNNFAGRVRLLLANGVDPDGVGTRHPIVGSRTAYEIALRQGGAEIAELLRRAGAAPVVLDPVGEVVAAVLAGDVERVDALRVGDPTIVDQAIAASPGAVMQAIDLRRPDAIRLLVELGFDVNALRRATALHNAVASGDLALVELLVELGADTARRDQAFDATPLDWARHGRHEAIIAFLEPLTDELEGEGGAS